MKIKIFLVVSFSVLLVFGIFHNLRSQPGSALFTTCLKAGQHIDVGSVSVWNDADFLYVKYETTGGWCLTETHVHIATQPELIPQRNGNPIPGLFNHKKEHDCETEYTYVDIPLDWNPDEVIYVAVHAEVQKVTEEAPYYIVQEETAWGCGLNFHGKNWATYFDYTVQDLVVIWPESGTAAVAFEDLPIGGGIDYDYNDFVTDVTVGGTYSNDGISSLKFTFEAQARGAGFHHDLHLLISASTFDSAGTYTINYFETDGSPLPTDTGTFSAGSEINLMIFENTWDALPSNYGGWAGNTFDGSGLQPGRKTVVIFEFTTPFEFDLSSYTPESVGVHGDALFFDPYLHVRETGQNIHITDSRLIVVPTNWEWPQERAAIWTVYPFNTVTGQGVIAGNPPNFTTYWYTETPTGLKWTE